ncbi:MAG TPA: hypothetical protein VKR06_03670 [Ktedonosporobacter sp.]|nr:hypothetical protein [Ktedonosporobacter sp.]
MTKPTRDSLKTWDSIIKRLAQQSAQTLLDRYVPGAKFIRFLPEGLEPVRRPKPRAGKKQEEALAVDLLMEAERNSKLILVHIEAQAYNDYEMDERVLVYNRKVKKKHGRTPVPCVLYLAPEGQVMTSPIVEYVDDELILHFAPRIQNVKEWETQELLDDPDIGLLPLLPLTKDGRNIELVEKMFVRLEQQEDRLLLDIGAVFAEYGFELYGGDLEWLYRRIRQMKNIEDLPLLKGMREKGLQEGMEKGMEKGQLSSWRQAVLMLIQVRFPALGSQAKEQVRKIKTPATLQDLHAKVAAAATEEEAQHALLNWQHTSQKSA